MVFDITDSDSESTSSVLYEGPGEAATLSGHLITPAGDSASEGNVASSHSERVHTTREEAALNLDCDGTNVPSIRVRVAMDVVHDGPRQWLSVWSGSWDDEIQQEWISHLRHRSERLGGLKGIDMQHCTGLTEEILNDVASCVEELYVNSVRYQGQRS